MWHKEMLLEKYQAGDDMIVTTETSLTYRGFLESVSDDCLTILQKIPDSIIMLDIPLDSIDSVGHIFRTKNVEEMLDENDEAEEGKKED